MKTKSSEAWAEVEKHEPTERQTLWSQCIGSVLGFSVGVAALRQLRGPVRWVFACAVVAGGLDTARQVGKVVGHELAEHQFRKADEAIADAVQELMNDQAAADKSEGWMPDLPTDEDTPPRFSQADGADFLLRWPTSGWQGPV